MQAKFLHFYPGYTWDSMNEARKLPFAVFVSLYKMIDAVQADTAIECDIPAISAVLVGKMAVLKDKVDKVYQLKSEFETKAEKEADISEAFKVSSAIRQEREKNKNKVVLKKKEKK